MTRRLTPSATTERWWTVGEIGARLKLDPQTIRRLIRIRQLHAVKLGHVWRIPDAALRALATKATGR